MEVKGISSPGGKTDNEEDPATQRQHSHEAEGVAELGRVLPFGKGLAGIVGNDDTLLPDEEVLPRLLRGGPDTDCEGVCGLIGRHGNSFLFLSTG